MDARIRYTKMRIKEAIFQLLTMKMIKDISVKEVCELAEINRATFYKHYMDIYDLVEKLETELLDGIFFSTELIVSPKSEPEDDAAAAGDDLVRIQHLNNIAMNQGAIHILGSGKGDRLYCKKIAKNLLRPNEIDRQLLNSDDDLEKDRLSKEILSSAVGEIIFHWIENGAKEKVDEIAKQIGTFEALVGGYFAPEKAHDQSDASDTDEDSIVKNEAAQADVATGTNLMGWLKRTLFAE